MVADPAVEANTSSFRSIDLIAPIGLVGKEDMPAQHPPEPLMVKPPSVEVKAVKLNDSAPLASMYPTSSWPEVMVEALMNSGAADISKAAIPSRTMSMIT